MKYRKMGRTGLKISEISIGAWLTFGAKVDVDNTVEILRAALDGGVNFIDTADVYARGKAEEVVGRALVPFKRSDLVVSSKVFWPMSDNPNDRGLSRKHIFESVEGSLRRLKTDYLDLYFCHRWDPDTPLEETVRAMDDLVRQGKILYWGTSVWSAEQIEEACDLADARGYYRPTVEQPRYNLLDRHIEADILPTCRERGLGIVPWSPLAGGVLTGKYNRGIPKGSRGAESQWLSDTLTPENLEKTSEFTQLAGDLGVKPGQLALAWLLKQPGVTSVITGASKLGHIQSNLKAAEIDLNEEVLTRLGALFPR